MLPDKTPYSRIDASSASGLKKIISQLEYSLPLPQSKNLDAFTILAIKEIQLAIRMDILAARRALLGKNIRQGKMPTIDELNDLKIKIGQMSDHFKTRWLERNKLSRLQDNLNLFKQAQLEITNLKKNLK